MTPITVLFWIFGMALVALVALRLFTRKRSDSDEAAPGT